MLSRVANSMYWMSRYIERAENVARTIEVNSYLTMDLAGEDHAQWMPLVKISASEEPFRGRYDEANATNVIQFLAFDRENPNSILSCLSAARENARAIRPSLTSELWEQLNRMYLYVRRASTTPRIFEDPHEFYTRLKLGSHLFVGIMEVTMTHSEAWHFCRLGRTLERADQTSRLLDVKSLLLLPPVEVVGRAVDDIQWGAVLRSASAFEMYRQKYGVILPHRIVEFLLLDREFPRAVLYCLNEANQSLGAITGSQEGTFRSLPEQRLGQVRSDLSYALVDEIMSAGLHEFLDDLQLRLNRVGDAIFDTFFSLRPKSVA